MREINRATLHRLINPEIFMDQYGIEQKFIPPREVVRELIKFYLNQQRVKRWERRLKGSERLLKPPIRTVKISEVAA